MITVMDCAPPWGEIFIQPSFCAVIDGGNAWEYMHLGAIDYTLPIDYTPPIDPTEVVNLDVDVTEVITGEAGSDESVDGEDIGLPQRPVDPDSGWLRWKYQYRSFVVLHELLLAYAVDYVHSIDKHEV